MGTSSKRSEANKIAKEQLEFEKKQAKILNNRFNKFFLPVLEKQSQYVKSLDKRQFVSRNQRNILSSFNSSMSNLRSNASKRGMSAEQQENLESLFEFNKEKSLGDSVNTAEQQINAMQGNFTQMGIQSDLQGRGISASSIGNASNSLVSSLHQTAGAEERSMYAPLDLISGLAGVGIGAATSSLIKKG